MLRISCWTYEASRNDYQCCQERATDVASHDPDINFAENGAFCSGRGCRTDGTCLVSGWTTVDFPMADTLSARRLNIRGLSAALDQAGPQNVCHCAPSRSGGLCRPLANRNWCRQLNGIRFRGPGDASFEAMSAN